MIRRPWRSHGTVRRGVPRRIVLLLVLAAGVIGWSVGRLGAVPERPATVLSVYRHDLGRTVSMDLEEYVKGVVAAEMPATFHLEALKAQAVAARTLALRLWLAGEPLPGHPEAVISTDPTVHQAWVSRDELRRRWGRFEYYWHWSKINRAVDATRGLVLMYGNELVFPAYHASSGGRTEDSENYWTSYVPYLRSVEDPFVAGSRFAETTTSLSKAAIAQAVDAALPAASGEPFIEVASRYPSGRVKEVRVGDRILTGRRLRELLGLRSNWFEVEEAGDEVRFTVRGYGHGVGMSQYGADGMAKQGYTFDRILTHYYTGVDIVSWYD